MNDRISWRYINNSTPLIFTTTCSVKKIKPSLASVIGSGSKTRYCSLPESYELQGSSCNPYHLCRDMEAILHHRGHVCVSYTDKNLIPKLLRIALGEPLIALQILLICDSISVPLQSGRQRKTAKQRDSTPVIQPQAS